MTPAFYAGVDYARNDSALLKMCIYFLASRRTRRGELRSPACPSSYAGRPTTPHPPLAAHLPLKGKAAHRRRGCHSVSAETLAIWGDSSTTLGMTAPFGDER